MHRRSFLISLFSTAAVSSLPLPMKLLDLPENIFKSAALAIAPMANEIYGNVKGEYAFATVEFLNQAPWFKLNIPEGFVPLRAESDRINAEAMARLQQEYPNATL